MRNLVGSNSTDDTSITMESLAGADFVTSTTTSFVVARTKRNSGGVTLDHIDPSPDAA